jgi:hypothetical protein
MMKFSHLCRATVIPTLFGMAAMVATSATAQTVGAVPATIKTKYAITSPWYAKYVDAGGIAVLGSAAVSDAALLKARNNVLTLLATLPKSSTATLDSKKVRVVILATTEKVSAIPEYNAMFGSARDATYWAGFGPTTALPICAGTESNLLGTSDGENIFVHEFAHGIAEIALPAIDSKFQSELNSAFAAAKTKSLWANTYAITDIKEYWAEATQSYFNVNREGTAAGDGIHNAINTRTELKTYDVALYTLINRIYGGANLKN